MWCWHNCVIIIVLTIWATVHSSNAYFITVDAHAEECFFENIQVPGTKMGLTFEITEGGFFDIDISITGADQKPIYNAERETSGKYMFDANVPGIYTYCFSNKMSTMTPKVVMFTMVVTEPSPVIKQPSINAADGGDSQNVTVDNTHKLEDMIRQLSASLTGVKHEQDYMQVRDRIHRNISESTNFRVVIWSFFEAVILVGMTVGQIYYLKRFFEVRRVV